MQPSSTTIDPTADVELYGLTAEQIEVLEATRARLNLTAKELEEFEERQRRTQAAFERMAAAATLEEQQHIGARLWAEHVERPRAARRVEAARRVPPVPPVQRMPGLSLAAPRERREASSSRTSGQDPGDPDPDDGPWALSLVDRAPFLWRLRTLRCRLLEIREGVDR